VPAISLRTAAPQPEISTQVADGVVTELIDKLVGEEALGDPTQVEGDAGRNSRGPGRAIERQHLDKRRGLHRDHRRGLAETFNERPVISRRHQGREHGSVDQPPAFLVGPDRGLEHREHLRADRRVPSMAGIQLAELAVPDEPGEPGFRQTDLLLASLERRLAACHHLELAGRAERVEVPRHHLKRHSFGSGPPHRWAGA